MKKYKKTTEFLADQTPANKMQIELLRQLILQAEPTLTENIKWNAPNYVFKGVDRITFNLLNSKHVTQIVIHKGATEKEDKKAEPIMKDDSGLIKWNSNIRGTLAFSSTKDIVDHSKELKEIIKKWLEL